MFAGQKVLKPSEKPRADASPGPITG